MDYSHTFFASSQPFQQQFIGIPPLTPSHSNSATSDDYNNTTSPSEVFAAEFPSDFQNFDGYATQFANQPAVFGGPPTPPGQQLPHSMIHTGQPQPQQQPPVTAATAAVAVAAVPAPAPVAVNTSVAMALDPPQPPEILPMAKTEPGSDDFITQQQQQDQAQRGGSNSDEEELTPAQSRRKAQNRAAQRAFRERKERHVKDLEAKLANLEAAQHQTASENERLKRDLQKVSTENEILRATSSLQGNGSSPGNDTIMGGHVPLTTGPLTYNPTDFYTDLLANHDNKTPSHRIATSDNGERLLAAGATWDFIVSHDLFRRGLVDVADISNRLKNQAKCDGQGPVFEERVIVSAIEQSVGSGSDSLL